MYSTQLLDNRNRAHLDLAAELLLAGEIVAFGFNGIFVLIGDADRPEAARRIAEAKRQPPDKPFVLISSPEYLGEFVDAGAPAFRHHPLARLQRLQREAYCLGMILPAAKWGLPPYAVQNGTVLNVWLEYPPHHPARYLQEQLRKRGGRAFIGSSGNMHCEPTYVETQQALRAFNGVIPAIVAHDLSGVPMHRRRSSTIVDFTGEQPRIVREGSVTVAELDGHLERLGLGRIYTGETRYALA